jgi:hypothetical protein
MEFEGGTWVGDFKGKLASVADCYVNVKAVLRNVSIIAPFKVMESAITSISKYDID